MLDDYIPYIPRGGKESIQSTKLKPYMFHGYVKIESEQSSNIGLNVVYTSSNCIYYRNMTAKFRILYYS